MEPVLIEVQCKLQPENPIWKNIRNIAVEVGYPGEEGQIRWKQTGWIKEQHHTEGKLFTHALWCPENWEQVVVFDFQPHLNPETKQMEASYRIRQTITQTNGRQKIIGSPSLSADFTDDYCSYSLRLP
jgi:hypothetical protein